MDNYVAEKKLDHALDWYGKLLEKGLKPSVGSYNSLITIYGMKQDLQKVLGNGKGYEGERTGDEGMRREGMRANV